MISVYLSGRALAAARAVDPAITPAAVHAAVEIALADELMEMSRCSRDQIRARAEALRQNVDG